MRLGLFASGNGSNVAAILKAIEEKKISGQAVALVTDNPHAGVLDKINQNDLKVFIASPKEFSSRKAWEVAIVNFLQENEVDLIILAGFMRILGPTILSHYPKRIINIHPSLLPKYPGRHGIKDAYDARESETGITIHFVDEGIDTGEIIHQASIAINPEWDLSTLENHIHQLEHETYPRVINQLIKEFSEGK